MRQLSKHTWEFVEGCQSHASPDALFNSFAALIGRYGFDYFIISGLPSYGEDVEDLIICNRWPRAWTDRYRSRRYFSSDPVSQASFLSAAPLHWRTARAQVPSTKASLEIEAEARDAGLADGIGLPMFDPGNWQVVASLAMSSECDLPTAHVRLIYLAATSCQMRAHDLLVRPSKPPPQLTPREAEILTWTAAGKSYWEVSSILSIAEATVQSHLANARRKLEATNTVQAVAKAAHLRQIRI